MATKKRTANPRITPKRTAKKTAKKTPKKTVKKSTQKLSKKVLAALAFEKRSKAAKKGWKNHRRNEKHTAVILDVAKENRKTIRKLKQPKLTNKEKDALIAEQAAALAHVKDELEIMERLSHFVPAEALENLHRDGTLALFPSALRHLENSQTLWERLENAVNKHEEAVSIAKEFDVSVQEVYTLWYSP